jgi:hypothetical protein
MFRIFGVLILTWFLSTLFDATFKAADRAGMETFHTLETAATITRYNLERTAEH